MRQSFSSWLGVTPRGQPVEAVEILPSRFCPKSIIEGLVVNNGQASFRGCDVLPAILPRDDLNKELTCNNTANGLHCTNHCIWTVHELYMNCIWTIYELYQLLIKIIKRIKCIIFTYDHIVHVQSMYSSGPSKKGPVYSSCIVQRTIVEECLYHITSWCLVKWYASNLIKCTFMEKLRLI